MSHHSSKHLAAAADTSMEENLLSTSAANYERTMFDGDWSDPDADTDDEDADWMAAAEGSVGLIYSEQEYDIICLIG